jgi:hypothetical protein
MIYLAASHVVSLFDEAFFFLYFLIFRLLQLGIKFFVLLKRSIFVFGSILGNEIEFKLLEKFACIVFRANAKDLTEHYKLKYILLIEYLNDYYCFNYICNSFHNMLYSSLFYLGGKEQLYKLFQMNIFISFSLF